MGTAPDPTEGEEGGNLFTPKIPVVVVVVIVAIVARVSVGVEAIVRYLPKGAGG
jgi:hypothetical protein